MVVPVMAKGRKPTPTHLRVLRGNPSGRPLNKAEPEFAADVPLRPPAHLDAEAKRCWKRLAPELVRLKLRNLRIRPDIDVGAGVAGAAEATSGAGASTGGVS